MPDKKFELGDYVEVKDRIKLFYELYGQGRLVTSKVKVLTAPDGTQRVMVTAKAYRNPEDPLPGVGTSWLALPGSTPYTRGSEVENAETSAWGRAIGALGILIDKSIASANEIENKADQPSAPSGFVSTKGHPIPDLSRTPENGLIGTAIAQGTQDFELRQHPEHGWTLPFRVKDGGKSFIVLAEGPLAEALATIKATVIGQRVTVWGHWTTEAIPAKGTKPAINYRVLHLERIATPDGILPMPASDTPMPTEALPPPLFDDLPEPPDDVPLVGEKEVAA